MRWWELCSAGQAMTHYYSDPPPLDPFLVRELDLMHYGPSITFHGELPVPPDKPATGVSSVGDAFGVALFLSFWGVSDLSLTGWSKNVRGALSLEKGEGGLAFSFSSDTCRCQGRCKDALLEAVSRLPTAPSEAPHGPRVFTHLNVWNTCVLLLRDKGFAVQVVGSPDEQGTPSRCRWHATRPGNVRLEAGNPIELLGLAGLYEHHKPVEDRPYWWRVEGADLLSEVLGAWSHRYFGPAGGQTKSNSPSSPD